MMTSVDERWSRPALAMSGASRTCVTWLFAVLVAGCAGAAGCGADSAMDEVAEAPESTLTAAPPRDKLVGCNHAGDIIDSFNGVTAYCNDAAEAGEFQCDQFANRFVSSLNLPPVDNWETNVACQICDLVADDPVLGRLYSVWGPGYRSAADAKPVANDLLVWWEPEGGCDPAVKSSPGHVAVVTATDASNIFYIQQNWIEAVRVAGSAYASLARSSTPWDATTHMFGHAGGIGGDGFAARCWIHPECPPGTSCNPGTSHNPCRDVAPADNGQYCGTSTQGGFRARDAVPGILYECFDRQVANETTCPAGCLVALPGTPDACNDTAGR